MAEVNTSNIGFEKQIWDAACVLRGNIDASEYKSVVLGLIFLKYISDRFEAKYNELVAEGDGFEEDKDEYTAENIFFVPENARWSTIAAAAHTPEIGTVIDEAMRSIEKENKRLKDILPKNFARPELDKRRLGEVVDLFTNIQMVEHGNSKDILGRTYEYCLSKFAEQEGKLAGEFYTPACVVKTLVEILQPYNGRVYDKTTPRLIQFHILKNAVNPPFLGGFLFSPLWRHRQNGILARTDYTFWRYSVTIEKLSLQSRAIVKMYKNVRVRLKGLTLD